MYDFCNYFVIIYYSFILILFNNTPAMASGLLEELGHEGTSTTANVFMAVDTHSCALC